MNADRDLTEAYRDWRRLAEAESEAIGARNWGMVSIYQKSVQQLQARISELTPAARQEWAKPGFNRAAREKALKATINELIHLTQRNHTLIRSLKETARTKLGLLGQAGRTLKQIQSAYSTAPEPVWNSFS